MDLGWFCCNLQINNNLFKCLLQFDSLSLDQDMLSLRKECQEKDATIKDLTSFLQLTNKAGSKVTVDSYTFSNALKFSYDLPKDMFLLSLTA